MFDLKRPCVDCPFRKGQGSKFQLCRERLEEIRDAVAFQCHKTVDYDGDEQDEEGFTIPDAGDKPQQCAGLMSVLHREGRPNQIMQLGQRLKFMDPAQLDPRGEAYKDWKAVLRAHLKGKETK